MDCSASVGVGTSALRDPLAAGGEAARGAAAGLCAPGLVLVFGHAGLDQRRLLDGVRGVFGAVPLSGCSVEGAGGPRVTVAALAAPALECRTYLVRRSGRDPRAAARALVARLGCHAAEGGLLLLFPDGLTTDGTAVQAEAVRALPSTVRIGGGMAGAGPDPVHPRAWQYQDGCASDALAAALLTGDLEALALARAPLERVLAALRPLGPARPALAPVAECYPLRAERL